MSLRPIHQPLAAHTLVGSYAAFYRGPQASVADQVDPATFANTDYLGAVVANTLREGAPTYDSEPIVTDEFGENTPVDEIVLGGRVQISFDLQDLNRAAFNRLLNQGTPSDDDTAIVEGVSGRMVSPGTFRSSLQGSMLLVPIAVKAAAPSLQARKHYVASGATLAPDSDKPQRFYPFVHRDMTDRAEVAYQLGLARCSISLFCTPCRSENNVYTYMAPTTAAVTGITGVPTT